MLLHNGCLYLFVSAVSASKDGGWSRVWRGAVQHWAGTNTQREQSCDHVDEYSQCSAAAGSCRVLHHL